MQEYIDNFKSVLLSWSDFKGRSRRSVFWKFALVSVLVSILLTFIDGILFKGSPTLSGLYTLLVLVPNLALSFRRLHDIGKSAWWLLIGFIPLLGGLALLYFFVKDSEPDNLYGPNPKGLIEG